MAGLELKPGPLMDADTLRIRSIGKTIAAVAMTRPGEQGTWKRKDQMTKFLPELANLNVATSPDNLSPVSCTPTMCEFMTRRAGFNYRLSLTSAVRPSQDKLRKRAP